MKRSKPPWIRWAFFAAFCVLTFFCWCPLGYGKTGPVGRLLGIPYWAAAALAIGVVLFVLEWVYLFMTGLTITDEGLSEVVAELEKIDLSRASRSFKKPNDIDGPAPGGEDE